MANNDRFKFRIWYASRMYYLDHYERREGKWWWWLREKDDDMWDTWVTEGKDDFVVMQSTGLRDTVTQLIFEGDILKSMDGYLTFYGAVVWHEAGGFWAIDWQHGPSGVILSEYSGSARIIGNIHRNPELVRAGPTA